MTRADLVVRNGRVRIGTGSWRTGSVAVRGEEVLAVGTVEEIDELIDARTTVLDAAGGAVLPGFQDAHVHPDSGGRRLLQCDLTGERSRAGYLALIAKYSAENPGESAVIGGGWFGDAFAGGLPTHDDLDEVVADRPVVLTSHDGHGVVVNSEALRRAGIDERTPDPADGRIERDATGHPTGFLAEGAADLVAHLVPPVTQEFVERALLSAQQHLHSLGITAWQDAAVGAFGTREGRPGNLEAYVALAERGTLTARVTGALWWDRHQGLEQVAELVHLRSRHTVGRFSPTAIKIMQDGLCENLTAAMLEPYTGHAHETGLSFIDPAALTELSLALAGEGFDLHMHAVGDRGVRECLDALEAVRAGGSAGRHQIAHLDVVHPDDICRFADLDVIANITGLWARADHEILSRKLPVLGADREAHHFPYGSLHATGARLAGGSDWPVSSANPLWSAYTAVTRTGPAQDPHSVGDGVLTHPLRPEQALPVEVALDMITAGAAWANRLDERSGTLGAGNFADLAVLDQDLTEVEHLGAAQVSATLVGGKVVHEGPGRRAASW